MPSQPRLAYLFSRYPYVSQTFCDSEMLALESRGWDIVTASLYPPVDSFRHPRLNNLKAPVYYPPPPAATTKLMELAKANGSWPEDMIRRHQRTYGKEYQAEVRARNALYFADVFKRLGIDHVHVHFANRATHTMLFLKEISGISYSFTTHGQDFMVDLGNDDLFREMCGEAEFVVGVCDYSLKLMQDLCPDSAGRMLRIYNGLDPERITFSPRRAQPKPLRICGIGRLIEFKGFHVLIDAMSICRERGIDVSLNIIGDGPWREQLQQQIDANDLEDVVSLLGQLDNEEILNRLRDSDVFALGCVVDQKGASDLLPTVITEAMLTGLPIISTDVAGVPEMIVDGKTGYIAKANDPEGIADSIAKLVEHPDLIRKFGEAGRKLAEEKFSYHVTLPLLESKFSSVQYSDQEPKKPDWIALYDLSLTRRSDWLDREADTVHSHNGQLLLAGGLAKKSELGNWLESAEWLPDGMVLEMEWRAREDWRMKLEMLRTELSTSVDGDIFLKAARRAVWLATHLSKLSSSQTTLYAAGREESLWAWLTSQLIQVKILVAFEEDAGWSSKICRRIARDATAASDASNKLQNGIDHLDHGLRYSKNWRLGPVRYQIAAKPSSEDLLKKFLNKGGIVS